MPSAGQYWQRSKEIFRLMLGHWRCLLQAGGGEHGLAVGSEGLDPSAVLDATADVVAIVVVRVELGERVIPTAVPAMPSLVAAAREVCQVLAGLLVVLVDVAGAPAVLAVDPPLAMFPV